MEENGVFGIRLLKGSFLSIIFSLVIAFLFGLIAQFFAGGFTTFGAESWLYYAVVIPFVINFFALNVYFTNRKVTNKKLWLFSILSGFLVTLFSGTIGAILGETIVRGEMKSVNIEGTFIWGTIYAFCFLPFTVPLARLLNGMFLNISKKEN